MGYHNTIVVAALLLFPTLTFANVWKQRSSYDASSDSSLGRHHPIAFANETHGFVLGGSTPTENTANDFYLYTEETDTWTSLPPPPWTPRSFGYGVVLNQWNHPKAYLGFGASATGERLNDLWEFDMATYEWRQLASLPGLGRRHPSMVPVYLESTNEWQIHVGLGDSYLNDDPNQFSNLNDYWSYSIDTNSWTQLPDFPSSRRHHPFFFGIDGVSYTGLGHSDGQDPYIERDFYSYHATNQPADWTRETDFASYVGDTLVTTEARVAGTEFSIVLPLVGQPDNSNNSLLQGAIGFVLSGDGDNHGTMGTGEFHAFYPKTSSWRQLPPHPGYSRWAPGSFVMRGTARVYFTSGYDRETKTLHSDVWSIDLTDLFDGALELDDPTSTSTPTETSWPTMDPKSDMIYTANGPSLGSGAYAVCDFRSRMLWATLGAVALVATLC